MVNSRRSAKAERSRLSHLESPALAVAALILAAAPAAAQSPQHHGSKSLSPSMYSKESAQAQDTAGGSNTGFGRLFGVLNASGEGLRPQSSPIYDLRALGRKMVAPAEWADRPERFSNMPAGYTFLGQFIDHDITLDTISRLDEPANPAELDNARSVDLDLDNIYGGGPEQSPFLYNMPYLRVGKPIAGVQSAETRRDLLRVPTYDEAGPGGGNPVAVIGDPRNDENFVVSQLQAAFIAYHNRVVDKLIEHEYGDKRADYCPSAEACADVAELAAALPGDKKGEIFESARDHVIHYYHRVIAEDFLPRLLGAARASDLRKNGRDFYFPNGFRTADGSLAHPFIPFEFSVAAYRYGHAQVNDSYTLRSGPNATVPLFRGPSPSGHQRAIPGFGPISADLAVDWRYFFGIETGLPQGFNFASKIMPFMPRFLHDLASVGVTGDDEPSLAARNLNRGRNFRLPSGQDVAGAILPALEKRGALKYWTLVDGGGQGWQAWQMSSDGTTSATLGGASTPLWYYVLQESAAATYGPSYEVAAKESSGTRPAPALPDRLTMAAGSGVEARVEAARQLKEAAQQQQHQQRQQPSRESSQDDYTTRATRSYSDQVNDLLTGGGNLDDYSGSSLPRRADRAGGATDQAAREPAGNDIARTPDNAAFGNGGGDYLAQAGGDTLGPVGGTIVGEVLFGLIEHYREKTGKGLDYVPSLSAEPTSGNVLDTSTTPALTAPLTATQELGIRYQMRNLLYDAGVAYPITVTQTESAKQSGGRRRR